MDPWFLTLTGAHLARTQPVSGTMPAVSLQQIGALLALLGVVAELGAVLWILWGVGLGEWVRARPHAADEAVKEGWRRMPWVKPPQRSATIEGGISSAESFGTGTITTEHRIDWPAPETLEEVGRRLNEILGLLNEHRRARRDENEALRSDLEGKIALGDADLAKRLAAVDSLVREEVKRRFAERKTEAGLFAIGLFTQAVGAALLLAAS